MPKAVFVSGIGTGVGKTVVSALLCEATGADYWKPVQSGDLDQTDSMKVAEWTTPGRVRIHSERYRLTEPRSPHISARIDGLSISASDFQLPSTSGPLVVEGAGGLMVPLNFSGDLIVDLPAGMNVPVVLVSRYYLGSINHTLLSIQYLRSVNVPLKALVLTGDPAPGTKEILVSAIGSAELYEVPEIQDINSSTVRHQSSIFKDFRF